MSFHSFLTRSFSRPLHLKLNLKRKKLTNAENSEDFVCSVLPLALLHWNPDRSPSTFAPQQECPSSAHSPWGRGVGADRWMYKGQTSDRTIVWKQKGVCVCVSV